MRTLLTCLILWLQALPAVAGIIVDAAEVRAAKERGAILWDVRAAPLYQKGHIPGAVSIGDAGAVLRDPVTEDFVDLAVVQTILGNAGIDPAREIIVYADRGNAYAYFGRFVIRYFGGRQVSVFHDGIEGWQEAGHPVETRESRLPPVALSLVPQPELAVTTADVVAAVRSGATQIVDARTVNEYLGSDVRAIRGGHIPGAVNIPYERNWKDPDTAGKLARRQVPDNKGAALNDGQALRALYAKLNPERDTIVYCQSGVRAAETATVLETLGFAKVKVYDASWLGYAAKLDAPVERETFFNVGAMNARIGALQRKLDELERLVGELKAR